MHRCTKHLAQYSKVDVTTRPRTVLKYLGGAEFLCRCEYLPGANMLHRAIEVPKSSPVLVLLLEVQSSDIYLRDLAYKYAPS